MATEYQIKRRKIEAVLNLWIKRFYVIAVNIYLWFWLYRAVFIQETGWEDYLRWFFINAGIHFFVLKNEDIFFKDKEGKVI